MVEAGTTVLTSWLKDRHPLRYYRTLAEAVYLPMRAREINPDRSLPMESFTWDETIRDMSRQLLHLRQSVGYAQRRIHSSRALISRLERARDVNPTLKTLHSIVSDLHGILRIHIDPRI